MRRLFKARLMNKCGPYIDINTYKRLWHLCPHCGSAHPTEKKFYPLSFLPFKNFSHAKGQDAGTIYDYMVSPLTVEWDKGLVEPFVAKHLAGIDLPGKRILDISGGNGTFLHELTKLGATGVLTEYNKGAAEYARREYPVLQTYSYDFNSERIEDIDKGPFDIVLLRAALMFCLDIPAFASSLRNVVKPGAYVIAHDCVVPTLGGLIRVQIDDYSYLRLRQPETIVAEFSEAGFVLTNRIDETDPGLYVYDLDLYGAWMVLKYLYEIPAARKLREHRLYAFPARDRRRSTMHFRLS
jgi:SAM-dependent methyltransferase